jgi:hypothetical protein
MIKKDEYENVSKEAVTGPNRLERLVKVLKTPVSTTALEAEIQTRGL